MTTPSKRKNAMDDDKSAKRERKVCSYGESCYRRNPAHLREFSHPHLESILDEYNGDGQFPIPTKFGLQRQMIEEQLEVMIEKKVYEPGKKSVTSSTNDAGSSLSQTTKTEDSKTNVKKPDKTQPSASKDDNKQVSSTSSSTSGSTSTSNSATSRNTSGEGSSANSRAKSKSPVPRAEYRRVDCRDAHYRPMVPPTRRPQDYFEVVKPPGNMAAKHAASAPYYIFYTTITDAKETHDQPYSITFLELLDPSLGELKCSLQINFMVDPGWLLAQYYFAGYSEKRMTILYGDDAADLKALNVVKPHVDTHFVSMPTPFGKHHTKMMILCYEDGSLRVVVSTANLYTDDWENRTQGLWFSPSCPELPPDAMPHDGESPTQFKKSLLRYLGHYHLPNLAYYMDRVKRCDFSHINVFLVASAPGSHFDVDWGMLRVGALLRQHCNIPTAESGRWPLLAQASSIGSFGKEAKMDWGMLRVGALLRQHCNVPTAESGRWPLLAQASSIGSFGKEAKLWLTGDFLHHFTKIKSPPQMLSPPAELKLIYPSLENVRQSHDNLLGGGCLPYAADAHAKQPWLNNFLYQWKATHTHRNKAMPHIKSYTRTSPDNKRAAFYLLTSGNISKAAWGSVNKGNAALRLMSYEAGVLFLPNFVIKEDFFPLEAGAKDRLLIPYDIPPTKYTSDMSPWVSDYLR